MNMKKILISSGILLVLILGVGLYFLNQALVVGTGYAAKYICSQVFLAQRDPERVFQEEVIPTNALFKTISNRVDFESQTVTSTAFGIMSRATAVFREGCGCTLAVDISPEDLKRQARDVRDLNRMPTAALWPRGEKVDLKSQPSEVNLEKLNAVLNRAFQEPGAETQRNTQAVVVIYDGNLVAEAYAEPITAQTPLLGWSMSKSVSNALVGILVEKGRLDIHEPAVVKEWQSPDDPRRVITLDQLLRMSSGLAFEEVYGPFADATSMLYHSHNMGSYAAAKPLAAAPDEVWSYSSGTTNIISNMVFAETGGTLSAFQDFVRQELFGPLQMHSAVIEPDASGVFVGSSYMFATARDWARFGLLILNDGVWNGRRILPKGWVEYSLRPTPQARDGCYGAHFWLNAGSGPESRSRTYSSLPRDLFYMHGFNQQITAVVPCKKAVIVRLGVTHDDSWDEEVFLREVLDCLPSK